MPDPILDSLAGILSDMRDSTVPPLQALLISWLPYPRRMADQARWRLPAPSIVCLWKWTMRKWPPSKQRPAMATGGRSNDARDTHCKRLRGTGCSSASKAGQSQGQPGQPWPPRARASGRQSAHRGTGPGPEAPGPHGRASQWPIRPGQARAPQRQAQRAWRRGPHPSPESQPASQQNARDHHRRQPALGGPRAPTEPQPNQPPPQEGSHTGQTHQAPQGARPRSGHHRHQGPGRPQGPA